MNHVDLNANFFSKSKKNSVSRYSHFWNIEFTNPKSLALKLKFDQA